MAVEHRQDMQAFTIDLRDRHVAAAEAAGKSLREWVASKIALALQDAKRQLGYRPEYVLVMEPNPDKDHDSYDREDFDPKLVADRPVDIHGLFSGRTDADFATLHKIMRKHFVFDGDEKRKGVDSQRTRSVGPAGYIHYALKKCWIDMEQFTRGSSRILASAGLRREARAVLRGLAVENDITVALDLLRLRRVELTVRLADARIRAGRRSARRKRFRITGGDKRRLPLT
ncbi:MAG TPA: hypothetical protein VED40_23220 [Azospirillaceae bacterium]|nr:hypothetical protein [Azospirillaceae bacterium]